MLIFSFKLEKYLFKNIFPKILLQPDNFIIKGSFKRKIPYITDIDIVSKIYPNINSDNVYNNIKNFIINFNNQKYNNIMLIYITYGVDDRFKIETGSDTELNNIRSLLKNNDREKFDSIIKNYSNNFEKKIFYINELIWDFYKLRWSPLEINNGKKKLYDNNEIYFDDIVTKNNYILFQYMIIIDKYIIGIDVLYIYKEFDLKISYENAGIYNLKLSNYNREYYYMLFPFRSYFNKNDENYKNIEYIIENKFGLYKQLMVRIDNYHTLYNSKNINIKLATMIINTIIEDVEKLPQYDKNIINQIKKISEDNQPEIKIMEWNDILYQLYDDINNNVNNMSKKYFFKFYNKLPDDIKNKYFLPDFRLMIG